MSFSRSDTRSKSCDEYPITYLAEGKQYVAMAALTATLSTRVRR